MTGLLPYVKLRCNGCGGRQEAVCLSNPKVGDVWSDPCKKCGGSRLITGVFA